MDALDVIINEFDLKKCSQSLRYIKIAKSLAIHITQLFPFNNIDNFLKSQQNGFQNYYFGCCSHNFSSFCPGNEKSSF